MISSSIECSISCPKCDSSIILNGPLEKAHCNACQNDFDISKDFWQTIFSSILKDLATDLESGYGRNSTIFGEFNTRLRYFNTPPYCPKCKLKLSIPDEDMKGKKKIICASCNDEKNISSVPSWLKRELPAAKFFVNAMMTEEDEPKTDLLEGVALTCPRCGGSLIVDGKERIVPCDFCSLHVYLPDDLWLRLHPVLVKAEWFIIYDEKVVKKMDFD